LGYLLEALVQKDPFLNLCSHTGFKHIFGDSKNEDVIRRFSKNQHKIMFLSSIGIEKSQSCKNWTITKSQIIFKKCSPDSE